MENIFESTSLYFGTESTTGGESFSKTYPNRRNITVEFYHNGTPVKVSGLQSDEEVAELLKTVNVGQWEITC